MLQISKNLFQKIRKVFLLAYKPADLRLDSIIFSKHLTTKVRALVSGTGLHITFPVNELKGNSSWLQRFSSNDQETINYIASDEGEIYARLLQSGRLKIISKTLNRTTKETWLKILSADSQKQQIEFDISASELSRNKYLLEHFNSTDSFHIGYCAAESRIRSEKNEIKSI